MYRFSFVAKILNLGEMRELRAVIGPVFPGRIFSQLFFFDGVEVDSTGGVIGSRCESDGGVSGLFVAQQEPTLALLKSLVRLRLARGHVPSGWSALGGFAALTDAVLVVECSIDVLTGDAGAGLGETLLKVVAEEGVQNGVHRAVRIAEKASKEEDGHVGLLALVRLGIDERHLGEPIGQPAEDINGDDRENKPRDLAM